MSYFKTATIVVASGLAIFATKAHAQDAQETQNTEQAVTTTINEATDTQTDRMVRVVAPDGTVFYNRYMPIDELTPVETDFETVDRVDVIYEGRRFTNRIVKPSS